MKSYKQLLALAICLIALSVEGQVMPSPDATSMIKGINTPINLYNGTASVNVPLYTASANNGASVSVSLQYAGGGIKVNEIAGVAGLGWQLSAGGSITRVVRSLPDEQAPFRTESDLGYQRMREFALGYQMNDFEKDIFFFSFPGGGGQFIFSASDLFEMGGGSFRRVCVNDCSIPTSACIGACNDIYGNLEYAFVAPNDYTTNDVVTLPSSDVKIQFNYRDKLDSDFVITDTQGIKYYFGQTEASRDNTTTNYKDNFDNTEYEDKNERTFISSWHLSKIEYPNLPTTEGINFTYEEAVITNEVETKMVPARPSLNLYAECMATKAPLANCDDCMDFNQEVDNPHLLNTPEWLKYRLHNKYYRNNIVTNKSTIKTKLISAISFTKGWIRFNYSAFRNDLEGGKSLSSVTMGSGSSTISETHLDQSYFSSGDSYYKGGTLGLTTEKSYRLKLNNIKRDGILVAAFDYLNDKQFHANGADMYELPPRDSYYTDNWGYYNGGPHQGETYTWHGQETVEGITIAGMIKEVERVNGYAKANMLTKVSYPTGGYKEFEYDLHDHHGGVRIKRVTEHDQNSQVISDVTYEYDLEYQPPAFSYVENHVIAVRQDLDEMTGKIVPHIFESSQTFVFDLNGPTNGYGEVKEKNELTGSYAVHEFITADDVDRDIELATKSYFIVDTYRDKFDSYEGRPVYGLPGVVTDTEPIEQKKFPFTTPSLSYFDRGIEKRVRTYDEAGIIASEVENHFVHEASSDMDYSVTNHHFHLEHFDEDVGATQNNSLEFKYIVSKYDINTRNLNLDHSISRSFDESGAPISETRTDYLYDDIYESLPISVKNEVKDGVAVIQGSINEIRYPFDIATADIDLMHSNFTLLDMMAKNMIAIPVQTISKVRLPGSDTYQLSGNSVTTFKESHSFIQPYQTFAYPMDGLISDLNYDFLASDFELMSTVEYNDQGLMVSSVGQDGITTSYVYDDKGYVTSMTTDPGIEALKRTTTYEYYPMVGLKSVTGSNGRKTSYVYDDQNRLLLTKNNEGNILKRYRYNYATQQQETLGVSLRATSGYWVKDIPITFYATVSGSEYGSVQYEWTDGSTFSSRTITFEHAGPKSVSVDVFNLEHQDTKATDAMSFEIHNSIAGITLNGPSWVTYCEGVGEGGGLIGPNGEGSDGPSYDYGSQDSRFIFGFENGARCVNYGYEYRHLEYKKAGGDWIQFASGSTVQAALPAEAFHLATENYTIEVRMTYKDLCGGEFVAEKSITVQPCGSTDGDSGGGDGDGGGGSTWALSMSPVTAELCPEGEPSGVQFHVSSTGDHSCGSPSLNYTWEYKQVGSSTWSPLSALGSPGSITVSRFTLVGDSSSPYGSWDVRATVTDGCGATKTVVGRANILTNCSSGGDGLDGNGGNGGDGGSGTGDGDSNGDGGTGGSGDGIHGSGNGN